MTKKLFFAAALVLPLLFSCNSGEKTENKQTTVKTDSVKIDPLQAKVDAFIKVKLSADISSLTEKEKQILPLLFEVAQIMDDIYWIQTYGNKEEFLGKLKTENEKLFGAINYGPWERLEDNKAWLEGYGEKPQGANFYPIDMKKEEFEAFTDKNKESLYTLIRRDDKGALKCVWYHEEYKDQITKAAELLKKAADLAEDAGFKKYLNLRSEALLTDKYFDSDMAWMDMKTNSIDFVAGPIEVYEDALFNYKASQEAFILIKDKVWTNLLVKYAAMLPELQKSLPVADKYKAEKPGTNSDMGVYEAVFYAGDCNAGSKTIAINLPNDEKVQEKKGSRRLQLKNSMKAKFENILVPISKLVIDDSQQKHIKFDAFFQNTMFHETAHGLGIRNVIGKNMTVTKALKEYSTTIEEGKADILGLFLVSKLYEKGEFKETELMDNYVTFVAGIFRSVRFGASSSHGKANVICYNYLNEKGAFSRNEKSGKYTVDF